MSPSLTQNVVKKLLTCLVVFKLVEPSSSPQPLCPAFGYCCPCSWLGPWRLLPASLFYYYWLVPPVLDTSIYFCFASCFPSQFPILPPSARPGWPSLPPALTPFFAIKWISYFLLDNLIQCHFTLHSTDHDYKYKLQLFQQSQGYEAISLAHAMSNGIYRDSKKLNHV